MPPIQSPEHLSSTDRHRSPRPTPGAWRPRSASQALSSRPAGASDPAIEPHRARIARTRYASELAQNDGPGGANAGAAADQSALPHRDRDLPPGLPHPAAEDDRYTR